MSELQEAMPETPMSRRRWLKATCAFVSGSAFLAGYSRWIEPFWVEFVHRKLPLKNLPAAWEGRRIIQLSDLHVGVSVDIGYLKRVIRLLNDLEGDLLVLTGDLVSRNDPASRKLLPEVLSAFPKLPLGTLAVLGNHDYGRNWSETRMAEFVVEQLDHVGIRTLRNEVYEHENLSFLGADDLWGPNFNRRRLEKLSRQPGPKILLCHNPDAIDQYCFRNFQGWMLSGHTHGGQCKPPFLPPPILPVQNRRYTSGEIAVREGVTLYINRALGYLRQVRFNVRPEVTVFQLTNSSKDGVDTTNA